MRPEKETDQPRPHIRSGRSENQPREAARGSSPSQQPFCYSACWKPSSSEASSIAACFPGGPAALSSPTCPWSQGPAHSAVLPKAETWLFRAEGTIKPFSATCSVLQVRKRGPERARAPQGHTALGSPAFTGPSQGLLGFPDAPRAL